VDKGAIKPLMKGAQLMCPGLNSEGNFNINNPESFRRKNV